MEDAQRVHTKYMNILEMRKNVYSAVLPVMDTALRVHMANINMVMEQINVSIAEVAALWGDTAR